MIVTQNLKINQIKKKKQKFSLKNFPKDKVKEKVLFKRVMKMLIKMSQMKRIKKVQKKEIKILDLLLKLFNHSM